ncbi:GNAT family N-acetyltransferase [Desnuesiella massiliensis]|uniref:GNAT family N-acetyltransferase n=1 Tax=Desnuesiella massiliensis TaxID=1650662 RepID=UPI0006E2B4C3|nr:GNAT family N-acetyltransferase [Desnuesiella massiliensis]
MRTRNINETEIETFANLKLSDKGFNETLLSWIGQGITKLEWCFVIEDKNDFQGNIAYGVFDNELVILDINIKEISEEVLEKLLRDSLKEMKSEGFKRVGCHIYSDKNAFEKYVQTFIKVGFDVTQEKKSFVWEKGNYINKISEKLFLKSLQEVNSEEYINAIEQVTEGTLDSDDLECIGEFGSKQAAINYFNLLKDIHFDNNWWKLAYTRDDELIGLVVPQKLNDDVGAINYIGVVPAKRGRGYVKDLIIEGIRILNENGIKKVIADIDVKNYPLEKALIEEGFRMDCSMLVLKLDL